MIQINAQKLTVEDGFILYEEDKVQTIDITLEPEVDLIKDRFESWLKNNYDINLNDKKLLFFDKKYMTANGVVIPKISATKLDLKFKVDETKKGMTKIKAFASLGYDNWLNENKYPAEFMAFRDVVYEFVENAIPKYYLNQVEQSKAQLAELQEEGQNLQADLEKVRNKIDKLQKENDELLIQIRNNQDKINITQARINFRSKEYYNVKKKLNNDNVIIER